MKREPTLTFAALTKIGRSRKADVFAPLINSCRWQYTVACGAILLLFTSAAVAATYPAVAVPNTWRLSGHVPTFASADAANAYYRAVYPYVEGCTFQKIESMNPDIGVGWIAVGGVTGPAPPAGADCVALGIGNSITATPHCPYGGVLDPVIFRCVTVVCPSGSSNRNGTCIPNAQCIAAAGEPFLGSCETGKDGTCSDTVGNPCNPATGNKTHREVVYAGLSGLRSALTYSALDPRGQSYGTAWREVNERTLIPTGGYAQVRMYRPDGRSYSFTRSGNSWATSPDISDRVVALFRPVWGEVLSFTLTNAVTDESETYLPGGQLVSIKQRSGAITNFEYSDGTGFLLDANGNPTSTPLPRGRLLRISNQHGRTLTLKYGPQVQAIRMIDPAGAEYKFAYDADGNLASIAYPPTPDSPSGSMRRFHYNEPAFTGGALLPNALTGITDEKGDRYATYRYDASGRAIQTEHSGGADRYQFTYNAGATTTVRDPLSTARTYRFQAVQGALLNTAIEGPACPACGPAKRVLNSNGRVTRRTDWNNNVIEYGYDVSRNLETRRVEGLKDQGGTIVTTPDTRTIITSWHATFRLPFEVKEYSGGVDGNGNPTGALLKTTQHTYDASGNLTRKDEIAAGVATRSSIWTYTTYGRVLTATDPNNRTTTTSYHTDNDPDLGKRGNVASITNAANHITYITDYNAHGQPTRIVDPNGVVTVLTYDPRMRLTSRTVGNEATVFGYDPVGQMTSVNLPDGARLTYTYDAAHRLTAINDHKGNRIDYTLDAMGNRIGEQMKDPGGVLVGNIARVIDALNRLQQVTGSVQ